MAVEKQIRVGIRDAVNRSTRKPFRWGGWAGYQQLEALAQALRAALAGALESGYLHQVLSQVERALTNNRTLAEDVSEAFRWVRRMATCLRYGGGEAEAQAPTSAQVAQEMEYLLDQFRPDFKHQPAQMALRSAWVRLWRTWGPELLHCYDIPGLPADNLQLEGFFGRLRRHQRRISGRKSTAELRDFGLGQALFRAETEADLLSQLREVRLTDYQAQRRRLAEAETSRRFVRRLHRNPAQTICRLLEDYAARQAELNQAAVVSIHTS